jgi:PHD/YefM family antitoxin component YafN of YafNO toxin-antitoxin module
MKLAEPPANKDQFLRLVDETDKQPVLIQIPGRDPAVLLSHEEYRRIRVEGLEDFDSFCARVSAQAQSRGLTEDILAEILADDSH